MSDEKNVIILLDLAEENQVTEAWIRSHGPGNDAVLLRLTEFGVPASGIGTPDHWAPVTSAIERMLHRARELERTAACHYWVTGKAGLPAFFYLGYRLSKKQGSLTLLNRRDDGSGFVDALRVATGCATPTAAPRPADLPDLPAESPRPYFERSLPPWHQRNGARLPVGLLVTSGHKVSPEVVEDQLSERGEHLAAVLGIHAERKLDRETVATAITELDEVARDVHQAHGKREALACFIAGPVTLAFLVGRALSRNVFPDVRVYHYPKTRRYELAYSIGYRRERHRILFLASNPPDTERLDLDEELRAVKQALRCSKHAARFSLEATPAPRPGELLDQLCDLEPTILHFSGHGSPSGVVLRTERGDSRPLTGDQIAKALAAARASVRIVILNACYSREQAKALLAYADCVVAMCGPIRNECARAFAVGFYRGLGARESVQTAFEQGRARFELALEDPSSVSRDVDPQDAGEATPADLPMLYVRDGVDPATIVLADWG